MRVFNIVGPVLLGLVLMAGTAVPIAAQSGSAAEAAASLPGLEKMYGRTASTDFSAPATDESETSWLVLMAYVVDFDSEESATAAAPILGEQGPVQSFATQMDGASVEEARLDLEVEHSALKVKSVEDGVTGTGLQVVVQDGEYLYLVFGMALGADPTITIEALVTMMMEAEVSDDPEAFSADGTSAGGLWAKLPSTDALQADAEELGEVEDEIVFTARDATPQS